MKASRSPRIQVISEFLEAKYILDYPLQEVTADQLEKMVNSAMGSDETFNFAWIKIKPFDRKYILKKVTNQVHKRLTSTK